MNGKLRLGAVSPLALALLVVAQAATAQERGVTYSFTGTPGMLEMPGALASSEGTLGVTLSGVGSEFGFMLGFQASPNLWFGSRLTRLSEFELSGESYSSRSFDLRYHIMPEGEGWQPALTLGLQDFLRNGVNSGEYLVATKTVSDAVRLTGGLGWGRFATQDGFDNLLGLDAREGFVPGETGKGLELGNLFHGQMAVFGGVEWAFADDYTLKVEYSSDAGARDARGDWVREGDSPWNLGLVWRPNALFNLQGAYLNGEEFAIGATFYLNPNKSIAPSRTTTLPVPVLQRAAETPKAGTRAELAADLRREGIVLEALEQTQDRWRLRYTNTRYRSEAEAMGRILRVLSRQAPASVEAFTLEPLRNGMPLSSATYGRSALERSANAVGGAAQMAAARDLRFAGAGEGLVGLPSKTFTWHLGPSFEVSSKQGGDGAPDLSVDVKASAQWRITSGLIAEGALSWRVATTADETTPTPYEGVPLVRRDSALYGKDAVGIERLALSYWGRPGQDLYGRVSAGLLESAYAGVSAEVLYKPVRSNWALGADLAYVEKRDYDMLFEMQDYDTVTGHATVYYNFGEGLHASLAAGKYLAGDWGATLTLDREFNNGWKLGAYATLTDLDHPDYKDGAFDKGVTLTVPFDYITGRPTRSSASVSFDSTNGDGGARLRNAARLYETIRPAHEADLDASWGRFWK